MEVFHTMTSEHPESGRSQWVLGDSHFAAGQNREGLRAYRNAVGLLRGPYDLLVGGSRTLLSRGYERAAEHLLKRAWEQRPEYGVAPGLLANLYDRQGRYPEAEEAARASLERDTTSAIQYHALARALQAQGRLGEAEEARRAVIRHGESEHPEQWVWLAEIQLASGDTTAARASLDSARARLRTPEEVRQFDSLPAVLSTGTR
jgi:tetratricopeptide (TPR) repeat protein